ncbi:MAG: DUF2442 domain-containing protein [Chitinophagales bacterium]|nr:DUF2442 domain-containing protein [Chitinophagales bacterium]
MGSNTLLQEKGKSYSHKKKSINCNIENAVYVKNYVLLVTFASGEVKEVDFSPALEKYAKGYYAKYKKLNHFKKFKIENQNIVWGKDWDLIFPPENVYYSKF